jgi:hypothetical protein
MEDEIEYARWLFRKFESKKNLEEFLNRFHERGFHFCEPSRHPEVQTPIIIKTPLCVGYSEKELINIIKKDIIKFKNKWDALAVLVIEKYFRGYPKYASLNFLWDGDPAQMSL